MQALLALTRANIRSYTRDRAAVFWTLAFPLVFIVLFGLIFQGSGSARVTFGWVDEDHSADAVKLRAGFAALEGVTLIDTTRQGALSDMQVGKVAAIPLVADREKLILKRLAATPLRRWQLVGSNVLMRVLIAFTQAIIIVAVGSLLFGVEIIGSLILVAA